MSPLSFEVPNNLFQKPFFPDSTFSPTKPTTTFPFTLTALTKSPFQSCTPAPNPFAPYRLSSFRSNSDRFFRVPVPGRYTWPRAWGRAIQLAIWGLNARWRVHPFPRWPSKSPRSARRKGVLTVSPPRSASGGEPLHSSHRHQRGLPMELEVLEKLSPEHRPRRPRRPPWLILGRIVISSATECT